MKIIETTYDIQTGQETIVERDESTNEKAFRVELERLTQQRIAAAEQKATAKAALLERLGITADEAALLLS